MRVVVSRDGTEIAYWTTGDGPPLVVVHGAPADHTRFAPLLPYLEPDATVHAMDRRGRGKSGDGPDYHMAREFEDVAAVVDAVAEASGSPVDLYGHSLGGFCAFHAAMLTSNIRKLVLYEGWAVVDPDAYALPAAYEERIDTQLAEGDLDGAVESLFRGALEMNDEELGALRAMPSWAAREAAVPAITRELRGIADGVFDTARAAKITVPTLLLTGEESKDPFKADIETIAAALPDARIVELEGQEHVADILVTEVFAGHVLAFLGD